MTDLAAIVARDAEPGWPARTAKAQAEAAFQALEDRRALLALLRETRDALASIDLGLYPAASPSGPRTPWQDGWNAGASAMEEAVELALAALDTEPADELIGFGPGHFTAIAEEFDALDGIRVFETDDGTGWQAVNDISGAVAKGSTPEAARANLREPAALDTETPA